MAEKNRTKMLLNALMSVADPEIRKLAEKIGASVPKDSWFRSAFMERLLGAIKGIVESQAEGMGPARGALLEKLTDLVDFGGSTLFGSHSPSRVLDSWMKQFVEEGAKRLKEAEDLKTEFAKLKKELALRQQLIALVEEAARPRKKRKRNGSIKVMPFLEKAGRALVGSPEEVVKLSAAANHFFAAQLAKLKGETK